jgi:hypothetical protein
MVLATTSGVLAVGDPLPEITLPLLGGGALDFREPRVGTLLLFFWGSW